MPQTVDRIDFACTDVDPSQWPKLSCAGANQLGLEAGSLRLEANREVLFADNGQLRCFDDNHRLVFNRAGNQLELHEAGDILFLTGVPAPTEKLRIRADGKVGIGIASPSQALEVNGAIKATDFIKGATPLVSSPWSEVAGGINYTAGSVGIGAASPSQALEVNGAVKATDFIKGATSLISSQWSEVAGGISYAGGGVGIGTTTPSGNLQIAGPRPDLFLVGNTGANEDGLRIHYNETADVRAGVIDVKGASLRLRGESGAAGNGATERLRIDLTTGNVGIGTTSPIANLHIGKAEAAAGTAGAIDRLAIQPYGHTGGPWRVTARDDSSNAYLDLKYASSELLTVIHNGNVGIGTTTPGAPLHVANYMVVGPFAATTGQGGIDVTGPAAELGFVRRSLGAWPASPQAGDRFVWYNPDGTARLWTERRGDLLTVLNNGNVGIGIGNPGAKLQVAGGGGGSIDFIVNGRLQSNNNDGGLWIASDRFVGGVATNQIGFWNNGAWRLTVQNDGDVAITGRLGTGGWSPEPRTAGWGGGIHTWDVEAEGTMWSRNGYQSGNRDVAENYAATMALEPGDVVCLAPVEDQVALSRKANDTCVIGVVSTAPGVLLNENHDLEAGQQFPIALCGRVPCKVVAENGSIQRGDLLTSSSTPGHAMKAQPIVIEGHTLYQPGTIIGKALGAHISGEGLIEMFIVGR